MEDKLKVGIITSTHGLKGEVKVYPTTDDPQRFRQAKQVLLEQGNECHKVFITGVKFFKKFVILKFRDFDTIEQVEPYRGCSLYVPREDAVALSHDEYFVADLLGLQVYLDTGELFGELEDVLETGANDVYLIKTQDGKERLIPAIKDCIQSVDITARKMIIHMMEGLDEL